MRQDNSSGYDALRGSAALVARTDGRLLVRGADRRSYLQGLLTNDIAALTPGTGCYAAMLTAQGRMIADLRVAELGDAILLDVPAALTRTLADHFERFVFSEDVRIEDVTASRSEIGVYGPRAAGVLAAAPTEGGAPARLHELTRVRVAGIEALLLSADSVGIPGFDLIVDAGAAEPLRRALIAAGAATADAADVEAIRIESGRPAFGADLDAETIPLEAGLEDRAISRSKGCYVGQEVIVRVQDRGHGRVARRLVGLTFVPGGAAPRAGASITAGGRDVGRVTSATMSPALARPIALGYLHRDFIAAGTSVEVEGQPAVVADLPFVAPSAGR